ncbi:MAG: MATE family efflux transporter [Treponema sp.]|jgi:putative MATE family efflux protein|nr:MATE family efflux transporter [Treponema sp.]
MEYKKLMTKGKPFPLLIQFAIPLMIGDIIQQIYTVADSIVVGQLIGVNAFAAVSASSSFYWLIFVIISGFSRGFGTLIAQSFGAKDYGALRRICALSIYLTIIIGIILTVICLILVKPILIMMQTPNDIVDDTVLYSTILFSGLLCTFLNAVLLSIFRALGDSKIPLYIGLVCSTLNIIFDILLVLYTHLGIASVACATVFVQIISMIFCFWYLIRYTEIHLKKQDFEIRFSIIKALLRLGMPIGLRDCISAIGGIIIQYVINGYGTVYIAGIAAAKKLYSILFIIGGGIEGAIATFVAQNYGAKYFDRIKKGIITAQYMMFTGLIIIIPFVFFFERKILGLFISGTHNQIHIVLDIAVNQLLICLILLPTLYFVFLYRSCLQGIGNSFMPMISGIIEAGLRIIGVITLPVFFNEWGIYLAEALGWPFMALHLYVAYMRVSKKSMRAI